MNETGKLLRLTTVGFARTKHSHIVYLDDTTGEGLCSLNLKHTHELRFTPPQEAIPGQPEQQDPETGEVIPEQPGQEAIEGGWEVVPDPIDGHTHEMEEVELEDFQAPDRDEDGNKVTDDDKVSDVWELFKESLGLEEKSLKKADESEDFYFGEQWDTGMAETLRSQNRAVLTKNFTQKYIDDLCGVVREERKEFKYSPREGGDKALSDIYSFVTKTILNKCYYQRERAKFFEDMVIRGKAVFDLRVDFTTNLEGDIVIDCYPSSDVLLGPFNKDDLSDLEYLNKHQLYSMAKIKQLWPGKAKEVTADFRAYVDRFGESDTHVNRGEDAYASSPTRMPAILGGYKNIDIQRKEIRVIECWRKVYLSAPIAISPERDFYKNCYGWSRKDVESLKTIPGFGVIDRTIPKIRITKVCGNTLLSDEYPADLPKDDFTIAVAYCKRRNSQYIGKVELAKDSQLEINKRASQAIDIGNKMATYVSYIDDTLFVDDNEQERFMQESNSPGSVFRLNNVDRKPVRDEGAQFPSGTVQLMELNKADLRELLNTSVEPWGANTPGSALTAQQRVVLRGNQFLFDNLEFAEIRLGRLLIPTIQRYYSPSRIARLVMSAPGREEVNIDGTPLSDFTEADIEAMFSVVDPGEYDLDVTPGSATPTVRMTTNILLTDLAKSGYQVPPQAIIRYSDLPKAEQDRFLADIQQMNAQQGDAQSATRNMEIEKTLIAQGHIPPSIAQEFNLPGLVPAQQPQPQGGIGSGQGLPQQLPSQPAPQQQQDQ